MVEFCGVYKDDKYKQSSYSNLQVLPTYYLTSNISFPYSS